MRRYIENVITALVVAAAMVIAAVWWSYEPPSAKEFESTYRYYQIRSELCGVRLTNQAVNFEFEFFVNTSHKLSASSHLVLTTLSTDLIRHNLRHYSTHEIFTNQILHKLISQLYDTINRLTTVNEVGGMSITLWYLNDNGLLQMQKVVL